MKTREALVKVLRLANVTADGENWDWNNAIAENVVKVVKEALSAPARQCDVGTVEEQAKRMDDYCASHGERIGCSWRCDNCPLCSIERCELAWAHMPYEAEEGA